MTTSANDEYGGHFEQESFQNLEEFEAHEFGRASALRNETWFPLISSPPLYRGHASPRWKLETTLERKFGISSVSNYYNRIRRANPEIASVSGKTWTVPSPAETSKLFENYDRTSGLNERLPTPEYLTYLRHHGFPSPLLDWTRSIYIAAFFAYRYKSDPPSDEVAIFVLDNVDPSRAGATVMTTNSIELSEVGQFINTDKRHFLQQSTYTACLAWKDHEWHFASHEQFFGTILSKNLILRKCTLPAEQRHYVLKKLDTMNINAFSLFGTIESLMETKSNREFDY